MCRLSAIDCDTAYFLAQNYVKSIQTLKMFVHFIQSKKYSIVNNAYDYIFMLNAIMIEWCGRMKYSFCNDGTERRTNRFGQNFYYLIVWYTFFDFFADWLAAIVLCSLSFVSFFFCYTNICISMLQMLFFSWPCFVACFNITANIDKRTTTTKKAHTEREEHRLKFAIACLHDAFHLDSHKKLITFYFVVFNLSLPFPLALRFYYYYLMSKQKSKYKIRCVNFQCLHMHTLWSF